MGKHLATVYSPLTNIDDFWSTTNPYRLTKRARWPIVRRMPTTKKRNAPRRKAPKVAGPPLVFRSLADVPLICTIHDVCAIYRRSRTSVLRDIRNKVFTPVPFAERPYYWNKGDIERDLQLKSAAAQERMRLTTQRTHAAAATT